jgi:hypothetical protein
VGADRTCDTDGQRAERRREVNLREVLNAIFYVLSTGCQLPVAGVAEGSAADEHRAFFFHAVGLGRHSGAHPSRALRRCRYQGPRAARRLSAPVVGCSRSSKRNELHKFIALSSARFRAICRPSPRSSGWPRSASCSDALPAQAIQRESQLPGSALR